MNKQVEALKLAEEIFSGMLHGTDWNNGTHANIYRPKFPKALAAIREALADHSGDADEMVAEPDDLDWITPEAVFEAKLAAHGIPNPTAEPVKQEPVALPICNLWVDPITKQYVVDHCDHPIEELIPAYAAPVQPVKQEPVGIVKSSEEWGVAGVLIAGLPIGTKLYAAPVSVEFAVLAEREACAKVCDDYAAKCAENENWEAEDVSLINAAAIRARSEK